MESNLRILTNLFCHNNHKFRIKLVLEIFKSRFDHLNVLNQVFWLEGSFSYDHGMEWNDLFHYYVNCIPFHPTKQTNPKKVVVPRFETGGGRYSLAYQQITAA